MKITFFTGYNDVRSDILNESMGAENHIRVNGGDAAENRKFERGNVALLWTKNFQHLMFNENFKFFN